MMILKWLGLHPSGHPLSPWSRQMTLPGSITMAKLNKINHSWLWNSPDFSNWHNVQGTLYTFHPSTLWHWYTKFDLLHISQFPGVSIGEYLQLGWRFAWIRSSKYGLFHWLKWWSHRVHFGVNQISLEPQNLITLYFSGMGFHVSSGF